MGELSNDDVVLRCAAKRGIVPRDLFFAIYQDKNFSNHLEIAEYRFLRWYNYGDLESYLREIMKQDAGLV